jgi:hypothetical protein
VHCTLCTMTCNKDKHTEKCCMNGYTNYFKTLSLKPRSTIYKPYHASWVLPKLSMFAWLEILTAVLIKIQTFYDMTVFSLDSLLTKIQKSFRTWSLSINRQDLNHVHVPTSKFNLNYNTICRKHPKWPNILPTIKIQNN